MDSSAPRSAPALDQLLDVYEAAIASLEAIAVDEAKTEVSHQLTIDALLARDAVEKCRQAQETSPASLPSAKTYARLIQLDQRLNAKKTVIATHGHLETSRQSLNPPESSWWWFIALPPQTVKQHEKDRFDWIWNGLTVVCLVTATSFATSTAKAFSIQGFDVLGLFSSFIQGAGLAFIAGGAFTDKGQKTVQNALRSVNIPSHHHAEATCLLSASLLAVSFTGYSNLYRLGNLYYAWGQGERDRGDNISAFRTFQKTLDFAPNKREAYSALGQVAEKMGRLEEAATYYEQGLALSDPASALGLARLGLINTLKESGWNQPMDSTKVREIEFFLELASQFNVLFDEDGNAREVVDVVIDSQTHYGILELAKIDFAAMRPSQAGAATVEQKRATLAARLHLRRALTYFQEAHWEESLTLATYRPEDQQALLAEVLQPSQPVASLALADPQLSEGEERLLRLALDQAGNRTHLDFIDPELVGALAQRNYLERTHLIDRFIAQELPPELKKQLDENLTLDLGKPRCYIAIILLIDYSLETYVDGGKGEGKRPGLLQARRQFTSSECGNIEAGNGPSGALGGAPGGALGDAPGASRAGNGAPPPPSTPAGPALNRLNLYTLSIHEKSLINELLNVPDAFAPTVSP